jgi:Arc/MetJ-type ribon-helix-helix transcriptional regulator
VREHQISVNLKPQQFELLQRLAREKGYKSVSAYVREKIVELAMNLEPIGSNEARSAGGQSLVDAKLVKDLERIHEELRHFVQESLGATVEGGVPLESSDMVSTVESQSSSSSSNVEKSVDIQVREDANRFEGQAIPRSNLGGFGFGLGGLGAMFGGRSGGAGLLGGGDRLSGYREILDDLEELADRAFSISPRLGSIEEETEPESEQEKEVATTALPVLEEIPLEMVSVVPPVDVNALSVELTLPDLNEVSNLDEVSNLEEVTEREDVSEQEQVTNTESSIAAPDQIEAEAVSPDVAGDEFSGGEEVPLPAHEMVAMAEDDILSDLLDKELIALSQAPRAENPFINLASPGFVFTPEVSGQPTDQSAPITPPPQPSLDPFGAEEQMTPPPQPSLDPFGAEEQMTPPSQPSLDPFGAEEQMTPPPQPSLDPFGAEEQMPPPPQPSLHPFSSEEQKLTPASSIYNADSNESVMGALADSLESNSAANVNKTSSEDDKTAKPSGVVKGSSQGGESQDVSSGGVSGLSGGPPPKRRRT